MCILPSNREGLGQVLLEALACGVPVVASDAGGIPEIIEHRFSGLIFPVADSGTLASNIRSLLEDQRLATSLGQAGEALARERFSNTRMAEEHSAVYRGVVPKAQS